MKKIIIIAALLLSCAAALASNSLTATVTVTNATVNGMTFTVNSTTFTWTNQVFQPSTQVLTNSDATGCGSATNLFDALALNPPPQVRVNEAGTNSITLSTGCGVSLVVTPSAGYASVSYVTNTCLTGTAVIEPLSNFAATVRTNIASMVAQDLSDYSTNPVSQNSVLASQLAGIGNTQTITGAKNFNNSGSSFAGALNQPSGVSNYINGGYSVNTTNSNPVSTNAVNYGNAFSSPGPGTFSEQFGNGAQATNSLTVAVGPGALAYGSQSSSLGGEAESDGFHSVSIGPSAHSIGSGDVSLGDTASASGGNSLAVGFRAAAGGTNSTALGSQARADYTNSTAIGAFATTTAPNQVMLGAPGISAVVQNNLNVGTNLTVGGDATIGGNFNVTGLQSNAYLTGRAIFTNSMIAFGHFSVTSLTSGNNAGIVTGTNTVIYVSGPTGPFTNCGIAAGIDGQMIWIKNKTGQTMAFANQSGVDPAPANRIRTGTGGDYVNTNNPGLVALQYDGVDGRWDIVSHN